MTTETKATRAEAKTIPPALRKRSSGILLHVTSLPSPFGIGDVGPEARAFADFLHDSKQKFWQLLPIGPVEKSQHYSPYSTTSSMAGNPLLISPEILVEDGLLTETDVKRPRIQNKGKVKYEEAEKVKEQLFEKAWQNFLTRPANALNRHYEMFCDEEASWLDDYALFVVLKQLHGTPWYEWPGEFRKREPKALDNFLKLNKESVEKVKWLQFNFTRQWERLRLYCNQLNISLFGDLPFYVSYDSADVWANPEIFALSKDLAMTAMAGVPPDYFNADGQLWGMPVFRWDVLKADNYKWWIQRLRKNIELFDVVRLDHFRAFADYWEVPAGETTAKNGNWKPGPGKDFFMVIQKEMGKLPFIAEDLGDINEAVHKLRDQFRFPGMKILQFAFGDNVGTSDYIPHQYTPDFIAYTGTHDNNTTRGWFRKDIGKKERSNLSHYMGRKVTEDNVHIELARIAHASVARTVIIPMQDILGLDERARMNMPASVKNNWLWRLKADEGKDKKITERLKLWAEIYNRA